MSAELLREAVRLMLESSERYCHFYKASDGKWYMELASRLHGDREDATTYGPYDSMDSALNGLDLFSNPGSYGEDDSGRAPPPTKSPNGSPIQRVGGPITSFRPNTSFFNTSSTPKADPAAEKRNYVRGVAEAKKPYLVGKWSPVKAKHNHRDDCWEAEDSKVGKVYLTFTSFTSYKNVDRLRDPSGTRHSWSAYLGTSSFAMYEGDGGFKVFSVVAVGEGREYEKRDAVRQRMMKLFGIDPYSYLGGMEPKEEPKPEAQKTPTPVTGGKTYKVYGKMKGAPAHTRLKGKAYLAPGDTKFKSGQSVGVEPKDGKLSVKDVNSDHTQIWEPEN